MSEFIMCTKALYPTERKDLGMVLRVYLYFMFRIECNFILDRQAAAFTASVQHVEAELSAQIRYLTQVCVVGPATLAPQLSALALFFKSPGHSFGPRSQPRPALPSGPVDPGSIPPFQDRFPVSLSCIT